MAPKIKTVVKIQIPGGKANPAPPVGTALGPHGIDMQGFCSQFNERTKDVGGTIIPVEVTIYEDRSFSFITKKPPAAVLIKNAINLEKGSAVPHKDKVGKITKDQLRKVAEEKMEDLNANDIDAAMKVMAGTARSMGVTVE